MLLLFVGDERRVDFDFRFGAQSLEPGGKGLILLFGEHFLFQRRLALVKVGSWCFEAVFQADGVPAVAHLEWCCGDGGGSP